VTIAYGIAVPDTDGDRWFGHVGTTAPVVGRGTRKFITCALMVGYAASSTFSTVTSANAAALIAVSSRQSTLSAIPAAQPAPPLEQSAVPAALQRVRRISGLTWGEIARAVGVSRRTIHHWLAGTRVAGVHLVRLLELGRVVDVVATGSVEATRTALLQPNANGRSILDDLALAARPARSRPLSTVSVGDLVTPVDETLSVTRQRPQRPSSLRGGSLPRRRPDQS
jgi:transcriptional regulator with XRE-family HTH domain